MNKKTLYELSNIISEKTDGAIQYGKATLNYHLDPTFSAVSETVKPVAGRVYEFVRPAVDVFKRFAKKYGTPLAEITCEYPIRAFDSALEKMNIEVNNNVNRFVRNSFGSALVGMGTGLIGSYLAHKFSQKGIASAVTDTALQYAVPFFVFNWNQAKENAKSYVSEGRNTMTGIVADTAKYSLAMACSLDPLNVIGRTAFETHLINQGMEPAGASALTTFAFAPAYQLLQIPIARFTGMFKKDGLESKVETVSALDQEGNSTAILAQEKAADSPSTALAA